MYFNNFTEIGNTGYDNQLYEQVVSKLKREGLLRGTDTFNGKPCYFKYTAENFREGLYSNVTQSMERQRVLGKGLSQYLFGDPDHSLLQCCERINERGLSIYTAEANSTIFDFLKKHIQSNLFYCSEYFGPQYKSGMKVKGVYHQDLQKLSFPDRFFDIVMTAEVMEHVPDALTAEREIIRVLKPGGGYIFTAPYMAYAEEDEVRAVMENGKIRHLKEPHYHGDPVRPGDGILVFRVFSEGGLRERFREQGAIFSTYHIFDEFSGIISQDSFVHVVVRNQEKETSLTNGLPNRKGTITSVVPKPGNTDRQDRYQSFIFTCIPRCGDDSFRKFLFHNASNSGIARDKIHIPGAGGLPEEKNIPHLSTEELESFRGSKKVVLASHCMYGVNEDYQLNMDQPFNYILLRDPVDRFISHYNFFFRHLGYRNRKGIHINDLDKEILIKVLRTQSNLQLVYLINGVRFFMSRPSYLHRSSWLPEKSTHSTRFRQSHFPRPNGIRADESWLKEAERLLVNQYGAFGVTEKMEASLQFLKSASPTWLHFDENSFIEISEEPYFVDDLPIDNEILEQIKYHNQYDIRLFEIASRLLNQKLQELS